jgi:hypothetical protein
MVVMWIIASLVWQQKEWVSLSIIMPISGQPLYYYADFPYAARGRTVPPELGEPSGDWRMIPVGDEAIEAWVNAIFEYQTQLSTFWDDEDNLYQEVRDFHDAFGGIRIMHPEFV